MDLSKIDMNSNAHIIALYGKEEKGLLNIKRSYGFIWYSVGKKAKIIKRTEYILDDNALMEKALIEFFNVFELIKHKMVTKKLIFSIPANTEIDPDCMSQNIAHAIRLGFDITFEESHSWTQEIISDVYKANTEYKEINDFNDKKRILSVCDESSIDKDLIDSGFELRQYISKHESGIPGIEKKILFVEDLASQDKYIIESNIMWPLYTEELNDLMRRTCMMIRDSEIVIMVSSIVNPSDGEFIDGYHTAIYALCTSMSKKVLVYDVATQKWYSESTSSKRELVRTSIKSVAQYNLIGFSSLFKPYALCRETVKKFLKELKM
ncbi:MAG TPA: hypothetical protein VI815_02875 [Candidatus Nanoarchaeia archaeon]|nr:hypothetical protein [Candidatus Nanoarchaeia archaeon]